MSDSNNALRELAEKWRRIATNEAVFSGTQHGYRECADQLEELLDARLHL